ncbi:transposase [Mogibacterium diversum]|uniref:transposase n=1 Tax=Mogibacterium diversum TaxID=114527 RepID=UPI003AB99D85
MDIFGIYNSRLFNGLIESLNRKVKDLRRLGRGFRYFEHMRNRFLLLLVGIQFTKAIRLITDVFPCKRDWKKCPIPFDFVSP